MLYHVSQIIINKLKDLSYTELLCFALFVKDIFCFFVCHVCNVPKLFPYIHFKAPVTVRKEEPQTLEQSCDNMIDKITDYLNGELAGDCYKLYILFLMCFLIPLTNAVFKTYCGNLTLYISLNVLVLHDLNLVRNKNPARRLDL